MVIGLTRRQWQGLIKVTETETELGILAAKLGVDFDDEGMRYTHRAAITQVLAPWFAGRSNATIGPMFEGQG